MIEVRIGFRTPTAHGTTFGNYPLPCPRCSLPRPLCSPNAEHLSPSSFSLLWQARGEAIREATLPPCCPAPLPFSGLALPLVGAFPLVLPRPLSQAPGSLALRLLVPVLAVPSLHPPFPSSPCLPLAPWSLGLWHACRTSPSCSLRLSMSPALLPLHLLQDTVSADRTHVAGTHLALVVRPCVAAARRGAPPCPVPPRTAGGSLGCGAPLCFCPTLAPSCRRGTPSSLPCLLCPSALRPAHVLCGAIHVAALPLCPFSLPWPLGPVLPPVCSPSLVLLCPPSQVPWSLALGVSVLVLPLPSRHTVSRSNTRGTPLTPPSPCRSQAPWFRAPQPAACGPLLPPYLSLPPLLFSLSTLTCCRRVARMSQARISLPALPFPLSSLRSTLRRTPCRHVARTSQART